VVIELSSAQLIIKPLQKENNMSTTSDSANVRPDPDFCQEDYQEVNNDNNWATIPSKHPTKSRKPVSCAILPVNETIITSNQFACLLNLQESDVNSDELSEPKVKETFNKSSSHRNRVMKTGTYRGGLYKKKHTDSSNLPTPKPNLQEPVEVIQSIMTVR
jgi:hypothetical protein